MTPLFALLFFEKDPLNWSNLTGWSLIYYIQTVGGFATFAVFLWLLIGYPRSRREDIQAIPALQRFLFFVGAFLSIPMLLWQAAVLVEIALQAVTAGPQAQEGGGTVAASIPGLGFIIRTAFPFRPIWFHTVLTIGGLGGILAVLSPIISNLFHYRLGRLRAVARLAFKEGIRQRVLYAFSGLVFVALFAGWFVNTKPSDEIRTYVYIAYFSIGSLLLVTGALLAGMSLPGDMRRQSLQTVVTKPVERFEILLGRIAGFVQLMTLVLLVMSGLSLLYVMRDINPEASRESLKARVPIYGNLRFLNLPSNSGGTEARGENVGREWDYRGYLPGSRATRANPPQAVFEFQEIPTSLLQRDSIRAEFTFDIYRTTKGNENQGVAVRFAGFGPNYTVGAEEAWRKERKEMRDAFIAKGQELDAKAELNIDNELAKKHGYYEMPSLPVFDYQTASVILPAGLIAKDVTSASVGKSGKPVFPIVVKVSCLEPSQYIGMARYDFYLRADDDASRLDRLWFGLNYLKGAIGLWMQLVLLVTVAVVLSTYFSGVVAFLVTLKLWVMGWFREFVAQIAFGANVGGGPLESMLRLVRRDAPATKLEDTPVNQAAFRFDEFYRGAMRIFLDLFPDMERFDFTIYVQEGFDISWGLIGVTFVLLIGYLTPWIVLGFYLLRWKEVASAN